jgi:predicted RNA binding protein YcfA (HicA-like mRNA interferase family)
MSLPTNVWEQVKNLTAEDLIWALQKDGWQKDPSSKGAIVAFIKRGRPNKRVTIHFHTKKTYQPKLLKALLAHIGWSAEDLRRLKLIK